MNRIATKLLILSLSIFLAALLASPTLAHDTSRPGGCNHYYGNGTDDWIACCGQDFCSGNDMVNWCTTCLVGDNASDPTNHSDCFISTYGCSSGRAACETTSASTHATGSSSCDLPAEDPPPASTCSTDTFRSTNCGFNNQNWCEIGQTCSTDWVAGPEKKVVCPASTKLVNTGEYCSASTGQKKFTASAATKCEINSSCNPPRCSSFSLSKTSDIVVGEWISAYFTSAKSTQKNYLYVTNTAVNLVYLNAPNFSSGSAFDVPTSPGTYKVLINAYDSDCLSFFDWTGHWKQTDVCGSPRFSDLSNSGSTGCNANITVRGLTISGTVKLPDGTAYTGGATITLKQGTTTISTTTSSTTNGTYSFAGLLIGNYDILLTVPAGYEVTTNNPITLTTVTSDWSGNDFTIRLSAQPDLVINSITPNPTAPVVDNTVTFSAVVKNQGGIASTVSSSTRLSYKVSTDSTWTTLGTNQTTGSLAVNGTETETWTNVWTTPSVTTSTTYNFKVCADVGAAITEADEANNCLTRDITISPAGTPTVSTTLTCIASNYTGTGFTVAWTNSGVTWVDIDDESTFALNYYHKAISSATSTTAPNGFNLYCGATACSGALSFNPATTYYVRTFNDTTHSPSASFITPSSCIAAAPVTASTFEIVPLLDLNGNGIKDTSEGCLYSTIQITPSNCTSSGGGTCVSALPFSFNNTSGMCLVSPVTGSTYLNLIRGSSTADPCPATGDYYCLPKGTSWDLTITSITGSLDSSGNPYEFEPPINPATGARHTWTRSIIIPL